MSSRKNNVKGIREQINSFSSKDPKTPLCESISQFIKTSIARNKDDEIEEVLKSIKGLIENLVEDKKYSHTLVVLKFIETEFDNAREIPRIALKFIDIFISILFSLILMYLNVNNTHEVTLDLFEQSIYMVAEFLNSNTNEAVQLITDFLEKDSYLFDGALLGMCNRLGYETSYTFQETCFEIITKLFAQFSISKKTEHWKAIKENLPEVIESLCLTDSTPPHYTLEHMRDLLNVINESNPNLSTIKVKDIYFVEQKTSSMSSCEHKLPTVQFVDLGTEKLTFRPGDLTECRIHYSEIRSFSQASCVSTNPSMYIFSKDIPERLEVVCPLALDLHPPSKQSSNILRPGSNHLNPQLKIDFHSIEDMNTFEQVLRDRMDDISSAAGRKASVVRTAPRSKSFKSAQVIYPGGPPRFPDGTVQRGGRENERNFYSEVSEFSDLSQVMVEARSNLNT